MYVRNWMTSPALGTEPDETLEAALDAMKRRSVRRLPVLDDGKLVGIVTQSDLVAELGRGTSRRKKAAATVSSVMARQPLTVAPADTLEAAAELMHRRKISGMPVVEDGRLVGVITESDVFRALMAMLGIGERGARIVMSVKDNGNLLDAIAARLKGLSVRSLVTVHDAEHGRWDVTIRVRGRAESSKAAPAPASASR